MTEESGKQEAQQTHPASRGHLLAEWCQFLRG